MVNLRKVNASAKLYSDTKHELLVIGIFKNQKLNADHKKVDEMIDGKLSSAISLDSFNGDKNKKIIIYGNDTIKRIALIGLGEKKDYNNDLIRTTGSDILKYAEEFGVKNFSVDGDSFGLKKNEYSQVFVEGLVLGSYLFNDYKTKKEDGLKVENVDIYGSVNKSAINQWFILGNAVAFARDLGNHPANILTPTYLSNSASKIAKSSKEMSRKIFDLQDIKKMGMGAFYGVAQGAKEPAKMIVVEYNGGKKSQKPIALVGKGLTFDSGGISIKPSPQMDEMKFDMCGSATVMGVLQAVAHLKPKVNIIFAIGSTENMPGSNAQRPGDIVTAYNGKTIEVLNTDAEGRLVLADVLSYINKKYKPSAIMDFATLTGAVLVALGNRASGVMGNDESFMNEVQKASTLTDEKVWELPLWEEYTSEIKGKYADIQNIGQARLAGTITAGAFLKEFVDETPWVHMDIAGTAWGPKEPSYQPKIGATGVAVRLVYQLLINRS